MNQKKIPTILIIGAGPGGLALAHSIQKTHNAIEKKFNIKIFDRELSPQDRWQGYHISLNSIGVKSLLKCIPESITLRLREAVPDSINVEHQGASSHDHLGTVLYRTAGYQTKDIYEYSKLNNRYTFVTCYRNRLRDLLLEGIDVQWGKKCIGYEEDEESVWAIFEDGTREKGDFLVGADGIHSTIRKKKIPELKIHHLGLTQCCVDIVPNKELMDRMIKITGNSTVQFTMGPKGDTTFFIFRLIPVNSSDSNDESSHHRLSFCYSYHSEEYEKNDNWIYKDNELSTSKFPDDENPDDVFNDIKKRFKENRPKGKLTDLFLELWELAKLRVESDYQNKNYPYKTFHPIRRRPIRDIDPGTVNQWETTRVTLLGDAVHAMNPWVGIGTNSAIEDAALLSDALANLNEDDWKENIRNYELGLRSRGSIYVNITREDCLRHHQICNNFLSLMIRNFMFRFSRIIDYIKCLWNGEGRKREISSKKSD